MELREFQTQVQRLKSCFGEKHYPPERAQLLWREVMSKPAQWMNQTVDFFISTRQLHQPPLPADFAAIISADREREWEAGKQIRAKEADDFWSAAPPGFFDKFFKQISKSTEGVE